MKFGFGTQLWLRDNHLENWHRMLDEMSLAGLDGFEMCFAFLYDAYSNRVGELATLLRMHDLELSTYYTSMDYWYDEPRLAGMQHFRERCRFCAELGMQVMLLDGGRKHPELPPDTLDAHIGRVADTANELADYAAKLGLTTAWHQHWGSIFEISATFDQLMARTDPALLKFCPDIGQLVLGDFDVNATIRKYAPRIAYVHYKDVTFAGRPTAPLWANGPAVPSDEGAYGVDSRGRWVELGRGCVDFPAVTAILREAGYDGWIVDDLDFTGYRPLDSVTACKDYVNSGLGIWTEKDYRRGLAPHSTPQSAPHKEA